MEAPMNSALFGSVVAVIRFAVAFLVRLLRSSFREGFFSFLPYSARPIFVIVVSSLNLAYTLRNGLYLLKILFSS